MHQIRFLFIIFFFETSDEKRPSSDRKAIFFSDEKQQILEKKSDEKNSDESGQIPDEKLWSKNFGRNTIHSMLGIKHILKGSSESQEATYKEENFKK